MTAFGKGKTSTQTSELLGSMYWVRKFSGVYLMICTINQVARDVFFCKIRNYKSCIVAFFKYVSFNHPWIVGSFIIRIWFQTFLEKFHLDILGG